MARTMRRRKAPRIPHDGRCSYCGRSFGSMVLWKGKGRHLSVHFDHLRPHGAGGRDHPDNIVASCNVCNLVKGGLVFESFAEARLYVLTELEKRNVILLSEAECKPVPELKCERCGGAFLSYFSRARFCSAKCRTDQWEDQNPRFSVSDGDFHAAREQRIAEEDAARDKWVADRKAEKQQRREGRERQAQIVRDKALAFAQKMYQQAVAEESPQKRQGYYELVEMECRCYPWLKDYFPWTKCSNRAVSRKAM